MARWKLTQPHYLVVDGTEWEYKEIDRTTGKEVRRRFPVPRLVDPADPGDWTEKEYGLNSLVSDGTVIVSNGNGAAAKDIVFYGDPTPDMVPLDEEARAISAKFTERWKHPIDSLPGNYADGLIDKFQGEMAKLQSMPKTVEVSGMTELLAAIGTMSKLNQDVLASLSQRRA